MEYGLTLTIVFAANSIEEAGEVSDNLCDIIAKQSVVASVAVDDGPDELEDEEEDEEEEKEQQ